MDALTPRFEGTTINPRSLLSTDYFNSVNEAIMLLDMAADMPDLLDEVRAWSPKSYVEHFRESHLPFRELAIDAYRQAPAEARQAFDAAVARIHASIADAVRCLGAVGCTEQFSYEAHARARALTELVAEASAVVHGRRNAEVAGSMDQSAVDSMF